MSDRPPFGIFYKWELDAGLLDLLHPPRLVKVYMVLRIHRCDPTNTTEGLSVVEIAEQARVTENKAAEALKLLEDRGLINVLRGGCGKHNKKVIDHPWLNPTRPGGVSSAKPHPPGVQTPPARDSNPTRPGSKPHPPGSASKEVRNQEEKNQKNHGGLRPDRGGEDRGPDPLRDVQAEDLRNDRWLVETADALVAGGWITGETKRARINVIAAAVHALREGNKNPPGLFASIVRGGFKTISGADEEAAMARLRPPRKREYSPHEACAR